MTQRLPSVPYLTSLDKYGIGSLLFLVILYEFIFVLKSNYYINFILFKQKSCCWHSIIGSSVITSDSTNKKQIDSYALYAFAGVYAFFNVFYLIWFIIMAIKNSKQLKDGDIEYKDKLELRKKEFEKIDHDLAEKDREFDLMEKDKDVLEISEKANSFTLKNKPQMRKAAGHTQQLNKNQGGESNVMAMIMADMG